ncbi:MAG: hypothetical protein R3F34_08620 [Planctomycetota bacterium]
MAEVAKDGTELLFDGPRRDVLARFEDLALAGALGFASRAPWPLVDGLLRGVARAAHLVDRRRNRAARAFLDAAFGASLDARRREEMVLDAYRHLFRVVAETERFARVVPRERILDHVRLELGERFGAMCEEPSSVVFVTPHVGNWEVGSLIVERLGFRPFAVVAKPTKNHFVSQRMLRSRRARGIEVLPRRGAMTDAPARVRAGGSLGLLLDQRARVKPVLAPLFGRPARCDRSAGVLIRRLGVPLVLACCYRGRDPLTFDFCVDEVVEPGELASMGPGDVAARLNRSFERMILARPEQYFWLHDRYRDTPQEFDAAEPAGAEETSTPADRS